MTASKPNPASPQQSAAQPDDRPTREWWRGASIYQVYPRSFLDTNGDGIGDLAGITQKLDYIKDLGVDAVWLSPFFTSPMKDFGYDVADYCDVDPMFGTLSDFDALIERAHQLGLRIIIDQVYSHTSDQHTWFQESRTDRNNSKADWYVWADAKADGTPPNNWLSVFGGNAWTWDARRGQYYLHNFLNSQPDLNVHHPEVQAALLDTARFWLDRGVDGFRLDAINFTMHDPLLRDNPPTKDRTREKRTIFDFQDHRFNRSHPDVPKFLESIRALTNERNGIFTVAEVGGDAPLAEMKAFTDADKRLNSAYSFDFLYADVLNPRTISEALSCWSNKDGEGWPSWAFSNHDAPRAVSRWAAPEHRELGARLYILLLTALRGNVFIYQGEELGLPQVDIGFHDLKDPEAIANWPVTLGRDGARTPMPWTGQLPHAGFTTGKPWLPVGSDHFSLSVDQQAVDSDSMLHFTKRALEARAQSEALRSGDMAFIGAADGVCAFTRQSDNEELLCLFNMTSEMVKHSVFTDGYRVLINTHDRLEGPVVQLQAYQGIVLKRI
ncbi:MAG: alpha-amylase family glycosyl hydrolase [Pseudomonadota bacterium]